MADLFVIVGMCDVWYVRCVVRAVCDVWCVVVCGVCVCGVRYTFMVVGMYSNR